MFFKKKYLIIVGIVLTFVVVPPLVVIPNILIQRNQIFKGWDIEALKQTINNKEDFVVYFGTSKCSACQSLTIKLKESEDWKKNIEKWSEKKITVYRYYSDYAYNSEETKAFKKELNDLLNLNDEAEKINSTPSFLFFKEGEYIEKFKKTESNNTSSEEKDDYWKTYIEELIENINKKY